MGIIRKIQINVKKGEPPVQVESCLAVKGRGLDGDRHAGKKDWEVCLCRKEILDWMAEQKVEGLCFPKHKENLLVENFSDGELVSGIQLVGEEVILEISDMKKHCFAKECALAQAGIRCRLSEEYQMANVIRSGKIHIGEEFVLVNPAKTDF